MCKHCEEWTKIRSTVKDGVHYDEHGENAWIRYYDQKRNKMYELFIWAGVDDTDWTYLGSVPIKYCPWCGRKLEVKNEN